MAKTCRPTPFVRVTNALVAVMLHRGLKLGGNVLLTVPGRTSGRPRTTPLTILEWHGERFLQPPFGEVNWVRNLRAAAGGTLGRGRWAEPIAVVEVPPTEAAAVFKATLASLPSMVRAYFDVTPDSPLEAFEREAPRHPMFRVAAASPPSDLERGGARQASPPARLTRAHVRSRRRRSTG